MKSDKKHLENNKIASKREETEDHCRIRELSIGGQICNAEIARLVEREKVRVLLIKNSII
jgi:hypothetical protein